MTTAGKPDVPWVSVSFADEDACSAFVACCACRQESVLFLDEDVDAAADRINEEIERHRDCARIVGEPS